MVQIIFDWVEVIAAVMLGFIFLAMLAVIGYVIVDIMVHGE